MPPWAWIAVAVGALYLVGGSKRPAAPVALAQPGTAGQGGTGSAGSGRVLPGQVPGSNFGTDAVGVATALGALATTGAGIAKAFSGTSATAGPDSSTLFGGDGSNDYGTSGLSSLPDPYSDPSLTPGADFNSNVGDGSTTLGDPTTGIDGYA